MFKVLRLFLVASLLSLLTKVPTGAVTYNKEKQIKYYSSTQFQADIAKFCHFKTSIVASERVQVGSLELAKKIIKSLSDLPTKYMWSPEVDAQNSFVARPQDASGGMVYHFVYRPGNTKSSVGQKNGFSDYYREVSSSEHFRGCIVYSSSPIKYADIEYKLVRDNNKFYIQRTTRIVPKISVLTALARKKLEDSNRETLKLVIEQISKS
jgi:hypothetical protein